MEETGSRWRDPWAWGLGLWGACLATVAFPPGTLWPLVLLGPGPMWLGCLRVGVARALWRGWFFGMGFFLALLWWIVPTVTRYGNLPLAAGVGCLGLLAAYLALYPAATACLCSAVGRRSPGLALGLAPLAWTGLEWLRGVLFSGFPWGDLPQALWRFPAALRLAPWVGIDGVRLLVASSAAAAAWAGASLILRRRPSVPGLVPIGLAGICAAVLLLLPSPAPPPERHLRVGVVQGNIDQAQKWDPAYRRSTLRTYTELTRSLAREGVDLVLWPETAVPLYAQEPGPGREILSDLAKSSGAWLVFGAPAYVEGPKGIEHRNAVFLMAPSGLLAGRYDKAHLVPFGEYVPLGGYLPFVKKLVEGVGDFTSGARGASLTLGPGLPVLGPLVCFEVIFPDLAALQLSAGAQLLAVVTNDGWFGRTPGPYQHLAFGAWRAAETGLPLVRAANTGISAVFDGHGTLLRTTELQTRGAFSVSVGVPAPSVTPQVRVRPWIGPGCLGLAGVSVFVILRRPARAPESWSAGGPARSRNRRKNG